MISTVVKRSFGTGRQAREQSHHARDRSIVKAVLFGGIRKEGYAVSSWA